jgi:ribosomal-protein-serine acetyltransferase
MPKNAEVTKVHTMFRHIIDERVEMRPVEERYTEEFYALVDANRGYLLPWMPWAEKATLENTREYYRSSLQRTAAGNGFDALIFVQDRPAGTIGFHAINKVTNSTTIGYWLAAEYQGRGIITRCCRVMVDHAFTAWKLNRVEIRAATSNHRSRAIPQRLGFIEEGVLREADCAGGRYLDMVVYGMLAREWGALTGKQITLR